MALRRVETVRTSEECKVQVIGPDVGVNKGRNRAEVIDCLSEVTFWQKRQILLNGAVAD